MSLKTFKNEIEKISLSQEQRKTVNNHFVQVEKIINKLGYSNIQKQGSFGRGTVIRGEESDGYDLDIAVVIDDNNINKATALFLNIRDELKKVYSGETQDAFPDEKAVKVKVRKTFGIDVTLIYRKNDAELVFNYKKKQFEPSYALDFRNIFKTKNAQSEDNALRDLTRIYKHVRDSVKEDINIESFPLEILLYNAFNTDKNLTYENSLFKALQNIEIAFKAKINNNTFTKIQNPAFRNDLIDTKIKSKQEAENFLTLNTLVVKVVEGALVHDKQFHSLKRKYHSLVELNNLYSDSTVIPKNKTVITGGVFGGDYLD